SAAGGQFPTLILGAALTEALGILAFVLGLLILFGYPLTSPGRSLLRPSFSKDDQADGRRSDHHAERGRPRREPGRGSGRGRARSRSPRRHDGSRPPRGRRGRTAAVPLRVLGRPDRLAAEIG